MSRECLWYQPTVLTDELGRELYEMIGAGLEDDLLVRDLIAKESDFAELYLASAPKEYKQAIVRGFRSMVRRFGRDLTIGELRSKSFSEIKTFHGRTDATARFVCNFTKGRVE
jgi:hypothetical protein